MSDNLISLCFYFMSTPPPNPAFILHLKIFNFHKIKKKKNDITLSHEIHFNIITVDKQTWNAII